jgi:putative ABC transport system ATP-binding protein
LPHFVHHHNCKIDAIMAHAAQRQLLPTERGAAMTVVVSNLTKRFRRGAEIVTAIDDVSVVVNPGELTVAAGPSGSGKTTLLSIIAGFETPDAGSVRFDAPLPAGTEPLALTWRHLAFVPQALALLDEFSVRENVDLPALLDPTAAAAGSSSGRSEAEPAGGRHRVEGTAGTPADELLARLEIAHLAERYPSMTSGGEQQRTAVARALRLHPALLLGDEPTGHQDRERIDLVIGLLREHAYGGNVVLISSHDEAVIAAADRVLTLADGRLVSDRRAGSAPVHR